MSALQLTPQPLADATAYEDVNTHDGSDTGSDIDDDEFLNELIDKFGCSLDEANGIITLAALFCSAAITKETIIAKICSLEHIFVFRADTILARILDNIDAQHVIRVLMLFFEIGNQLFARYKQHTQHNFVDDCIVRVIVQDHVLSNDIKVQLWALIAPYIPDNLPASLYAEMLIAFVSHEYPGYFDTFNEFCASTNFSGIIRKAVSDIASLHSNILTLDEIEKPRSMALLAFKQDELRAYNKKLNHVVSTLRLRGLQLIAASIEDKTSTSLGKRSCITNDAPQQLDGAQSSKKSRH